MKVGWFVEGWKARVLALGTEAGAVGTVVNEGLCRQGGVFRLQHKTDATVDV